MALSKRIKCFKYLVYSYVVLLTITGAAQIVLGAALLWGHIGYFSIVQNKFWAPSTILLALGPVTFILCWMGCQATNQKKRCLLGLFSALLVAVICIQFIICGWALAMRESLPAAVEVYVDDSFVEFLDKFSRAKADRFHLWNRMQTQLQCCGVDAPSDYRRISLPWSCCSRPESPDESACDSHYRRGCLSVLTQEIRDRLLYACFAAAGIALIQSIGVFCAIQLTVLLGRAADGEDINSVAKRQHELLPLSITDKGRRDLPSPMTSPMAPGHRLLKTAPPPPPPTMPK